jgi:hypothetical protein
MLVMQDFESDTGCFLKLQLGTFGTGGFKELRHYTALLFMPIKKFTLLAPLLFVSSMALSKGF